MPYTDLVVCNACLFSQMVKREAHDTEGFGAMLALILHSRTTHAQAATVDGLGVGSDAQRLNFNGYILQVKE